MSCVCCSPIRARYKRLVDNIYPEDAEEGLVKANMEKLVYYAATSPEKLDRIGEYLAHRIGRDIYRARVGFVEVGMEAVDQLLMACQAQTLNLFVESYLKTVEALLESQDTNLHVLASESFRQFSKKEEDVIVYHRRYDFFIDKFSQMAHYRHHKEEDENGETRRVRLAGLEGLGGVVRKTVHEDMLENIWSRGHMDKIVPTLLYNIQAAGGGHDLGDHSDSEEARMAEDTFRKLVGSASFNSVRTVLTPVFHYLDQGNMWGQDAEFSRHVFHVVTYSLGQNLNYVVVEMLMKHLAKQTGRVDVRCGAAVVLRHIFQSRAVDVSVGPSVLETVNNLHGLLLTSVEEVPEVDGDGEIEYREALLATLGEYSATLPNFQMIEIMIFLLGKCPLPSGVAGGQFQSKVRTTVLRALYTVAARYEPVHFATTFPPQFLPPLATLLEAGPDRETRLLVLDILDTLIDRRDNLGKLEASQLLEPRPDLAAQKINYSRQDDIFFGKYGRAVYAALFAAAVDAAAAAPGVPDAVVLLERVWRTCCLLLLECSSDKNVLLLLDLIRDLQDVAVREDSASLHGLCISLLAILCHVLAIPQLLQHKREVVAARRSLAPHYLPPLAAASYATDNPSSVKFKTDELLVDIGQVNDALRQAGRTVEEVEPDGGGGGGLGSSNSLAELRRGSDSLMELRRGSLVSPDGESLASTPGLVRRELPEEVSFASLKRSFSERRADGSSAEEEERRRRIVEMFKLASFRELCEETRGAAEEGVSLRQCLGDIFENFKVGQPRVVEAGGGGGGEVIGEESDDGDWTGKVKRPVFEEYFPELFMY